MEQHFSFQNLETRKSLKSVFENIFVKYGREFEEDDEIDLMSFEVTKAGGHLARTKPLKFGNVFKRKSEAIVAADNILAGVFTSDADGIDVFEAAISKKPRPNKTSRLQDSFVQAVSQSKNRESAFINEQSFLLRRKRGRPRKLKPTDFGSILKSILVSEHDIDAKQPLPRHINSCFDCVLVQLINIG